MWCSPQLLRDHAVQRLVKSGLSRTAAAAVAHVMIDADVRGHRSHGIALLPLYLERIAQGGIDARAEPEWVIDHGAVAILDARGGPGAWAATLAARRCALTAASFGLAACGVRNNNHVGMLAAYREPFVDEGVLGVILNISGPSVAPPRGERASLGNNALCMIVPQGVDRPFVVDFATGVVACGKIRQAALARRPIPESWLLDATGRPSVDPLDLDRGGSVPVFGGHKGLCVSIIIEVLAGGLAAGTTSRSVTRQRLRPDSPMRCAQMFLGFHPEVFGAPDLAAIVRDLEQAVLEGHTLAREDVFFPEQQETAAEHASRSGIEVPDEVVVQVGLRPLQPASA